MIGELSGGQSVQDRSDARRGSCPQWAFGHKIRGERRSEEGEPHDRLIREIEVVAQAIIDRVLERGRLLPLDGPSMRTKHLGLDDPTSPEALTPLIRISGKGMIGISGTRTNPYRETERGTQRCQRPQRPRVPNPLLSICRWAGVKRTGA